MQLMKYMRESSLRIAKLMSRLVLNQDRLQKMQAMQKELNRGFPITEDEDTKIREWIEKHLTKRHKLIVNGRFKYEFQDFAEVSVGSVVCTECGESFTFRQY